MKRNTIFCSLLLALLLLPAAVFAAPGDTEYIVKLDPYFPMLMALGDDDLEPVPYTPGVYTTSDLSILADLVDAGAALYIEENQTLELLEDDWQQVPDEEPLPESGFDPVENWALDAVDCSAAAKAGLTGDGVCIAIIDSGLDIEHEDLKNIKISPYSRNMLGDGSGAELWYRDQKGHGSFVAGIIAAETGNGKGISSFAPNAELMILRVISTASTRFPKEDIYDSESGKTSRVVSSIRYAADNGADVINISMGGAISDSRTLQEAVDYAAEKGIIVVAAVGNNGAEDLYYPAACDRVIGAGATDKNGVRWSGSQHNISVDAAAPGKDVIGINIYPSGVSYAPEDQSNTYQAGSGTSYAAPMVSALAALVKEANPDIDHDGFLALLAETCVDKGNPGRDDEYGYGIISGSAMAQALQQTERLLLTDRKGSSIFDGPQGFTLASARTLSLPVLEKEGYTFRGWYTDPEFDEEGPESIRTADLLKEPLLAESRFAEGRETIVYKVAPRQFYACLLPQVSFYLYDGAPGPWQTFEVAEGDPLGSLPQPEEEENTFTGWYTRPGQSFTRITAAQVIEEPLRVYASWSQPLDTSDAVYAGSASQSLLQKLSDLLAGTLQKLQSLLISL